MKRIVILVLCLTIILMITPNMKAYAASERQISKSFVVRNWKGDVPETEPPADELPPADDDVVDEPEEPEEPEEQGDEPEELLADDHTDEDEPLPSDDAQAIPPVDGDEDSQGESAADDHADAPDDPDADEAPPPEPTTDQVEQSKEPAMDDTPAEDGEEEITITTEEEPEDVGEARVDIGGSGRRRRAKRLSEAKENGRSKRNGSRRAIKGYNHDL